MLIKSPLSPLFFLGKEICIQTQKGILTRCLLKDNYLTRKLLLKNWETAGKKSYRDTFLVFSILLSVSCMVSYRSSKFYLFFSPNSNEILSDRLNIDSLSSPIKKVMLFILILFEVSKWIQKLLSLQRRNFFITVCYFSFSVCWFIFHWLS